MRPISILALCLALIVQEFHALAQVPHVMTYQGRVASGGTNFSGTGQFKFALVSGGTSAAAQASASATVSFGFVVQLAVTSGGAGYTAAPTVTIADSSGSGALAVAQIANGQVTSITVTDAGSGYSVLPSIAIAPPNVNLSYTTYWSHDGTSSAGGEPASVVPVSVSQGLFTVGLGDTMIPNMSALTPQVLANPDVRLRMWFNDGVNGFSQLSPDQRLTSTAYAMMADTVRDGAITAAKLAPNSITSAQIAPGSIASSQLADGAVTSAKLAAGVNLGPPRGTIALSSNANDTNLLSLGYARLPSSRVVRDEWSLKPSPSAFRYFVPNTKVWTGDEVVSFGNGVGFFELYPERFHGERYNPSTNLRRPVSTNGAPPFPYSWGVLGSAPIWTGTEVILLGYTNGVTGSRGTLGARYNPATDSWRPLNIPSNLSTNILDASVLWTGNELIFWAGPSFGGSKYSPILNAWSPISNSGSPDSSQPAVWTGSEMIVFGSGGGAGHRYDPGANIWQTISADGAPVVQSWSSHPVWTGSEAILIGRNPDGFPSGGKFNPVANSWKAMNLMGLHQYGDNDWWRPIWTGKAVVVIGEVPVFMANLYDPVADSWTIPGSISPFGCSECEPGRIAVWTGTEMLYQTPQNGLYYSYAPSPDVFLYQKQ